jgi:hypothetical protein
MSRMATRSLTEFFSTVPTCALGGGHEKWGSMNTNLTREHFMAELSRVGRRHHPQKTPVSAIQLTLSGQPKVLTIVM